MSTNFHLPVPNLCSLNPTKDGGGHFVPVVKYFFTPFPNERTEWADFFWLFLKLSKTRFKKNLGSKKISRGALYGFFRWEVKIQKSIFLFFPTFWLNSCIFKTIYQCSLAKGTFWGVKHQNQSVIKDFRSKKSILPLSQDTRKATTLKGHIKG